MIGHSNACLRHDFYANGSSVAVAPGVLIIGIGNLLMGDEGVGIHGLRALEDGPPIPGTELLDGGTGGINLLEAIERAPRIIMIDATRDACPAGTVALLGRPLESSPASATNDYGVR